jgi:hypothetical protein
MKALLRKGPKKRLPYSESELAFLRMAERL